MQNFALALALATTTSAIHLGTKDNYDYEIGDIITCINYQDLTFFEDSTYDDCENGH